MSCPLCFLELNSYPDAAPIYRLSNGNSSVTTVCQHNFHGLCLRKHLSNDDRCPICLEANPLEFLITMDTVDVKEFERKMDLGITRKAKLSGVELQNLVDVNYPEEPGVRWCIFGKQYGPEEFCEGTIYFSGIPRYHIRIISNEGQERIKRFNRERGF